MDSDHRINKLPKWARDIIDFHTRRYLEAQKEVAELRATVGGHIGERYIGVGFDHTNMKPRVYFRPDETVRWEFGDHDHVEVRKSGNRTLRIHGSHRISIHPSASNAIEIEVE